MDLGLKGKRAIVTGGSRGIGKAIARELAREGADVAILARDPERLKSAAAELAAESGRTVVGITVDTTNADSVQAAVADAVKGLGGGIDILVNAAAQPGGSVVPPKLATLTQDYFHNEMNTKVMGYIRYAQAVAPHMKERGWGRIINISGLAARGTGNAVGSMRNVSVAAMTKNLADELGPSGINVTVVHPGLTRTERTAPRIAELAKKRNVAEAEIEKEMASGNSIRHMVDASEVAYIVAFLASPKSIAINGDVIAAGGGSGKAIYY